jgi:hypothetical protein
MIRSASRGATILFGALVSFFLLTPERAGAQVYDTPSFNTAYGEDGWGLYLVFRDGVENGAVMGTYRTSGESLDLGFRLGILEAGGDPGFYGGVDLKNEFVSATDDFPLDVAWVTGIGVGFVPDFNVGVLRIPGGVSLAHRFRSQESDLVVVPYLYPRFAVDVGLDRAEGSDLHFDIDLGIDLEFSAGWMLRFGLTLGSTEALGLGLAF